MTITRDRYKEMQVMLANEEHDLVKAKKAFNRKARELEQALMADTVNLFGEKQKTGNQLSAFDIDADATKVSIALFPYRNAINYHQNRVVELRAKIRAAQVVDLPTLFGCAV